jgi:transcription antitermination factor NusG
MCESAHERHWYAIFTAPKNEKMVAKHLEMRSIESFLPAYEKISVWKNRQRVNLILPLFPAYLFARIGRHERSKVLGTPGVIRIVGSKREYLPIPDHEIEFLRNSLAQKRVEPCMDFVSGDKVRIKTGALQGIEGTLMRTNNGPRFILSLRLINQHALVEIDPEDIEAIVA